ncbi:MAG: lysoplasmalogenase [Microbacterium sp.]
MPESDPHGDAQRGTPVPTDPYRGAAPRASVPLPRWTWGVAPYAVVSLIHVGALALGAESVAAPTKLVLMPLLAVAVLWGGRGTLWGGRGTRWGAAFKLLFLAIAWSWLGDGAGAFFPAAPELPVMLACFGLAHVCYLRLFWRHLAIRRLPRWTVVYALWWIVLVSVLWPHLGGLAAAVTGYGLLLGGTASLAARCSPVVTWGGALFLCSDTILALRIFVPDAMPGWTSPLVMLTYCLGQGLIATGAIARARERR